MHNHYQHGQQLVHLNKCLTGVKILYAYVKMKLHLGNAGSKLAVGSFGVYVSEGCFIVNSIITCFILGVHGGTVVEALRY
jgi:hypothetical protein